MADTGYALDSNPVSTASGTNFTLDPDYLNRQLGATITNNAANVALQAAQNKAQAAYQSKLVELQKQGLGLQAQQIAQSYALDQAKLEFEKQQFAQTYGLQSQQQGWQQQFDQQQADLDNAYKTAEQTGFRDGVPTLATLQMQQQNNQFTAGQAQQASQFNAQLGFSQAQLAEQQRVADQGNSLDLQKLQEQQREFNQQQTDAGSQWQRQFDLGANQFQQTFGEGARQFDVTTANQVDQFGRTLGEQQRATNLNAVLNAPRGPADWAAYSARMRGLASSGALPGGGAAAGGSGQNDIAGFGSIAPVASYSNQGQFQGNVLSNTDLALAATGQGDPSKLQGTPWQGAYGAPNGGAATSGAPQQQGASQSQQRGGTSAYGGGTSAYGGPAGGNTAQGQGNGGADISLPSLQKFRRYAPTEQQMGLGYIAENGGPTAEDSQYLMQRSAPNMAQSRQARYGGM